MGRCKIAIGKKKGTAQQGKKRGYQFEAEVLRGLKLIGGCLSYKLIDANTMGIQTRVKCPADFIISKNNTIFTLEAKTTKLARIPWTNFKPHQLEYCLHSPSKAYMIINFNNRKTGDEKINRTFLVDGYGMAKLVTKWDASVPLEGVAEVATELERKTARFHPTEEGAFVDFGGVKWY